MYYKGANLLHSLRQIINDDEKWRAILIGLNKDFYHQTVSSKQVEEYISEKSGLDLTSFWDQYLRTTKIPKIEYHVSGKNLNYRYTNIVDGFNLPLILIINGKEEWFTPNSEWQTKEFLSDLKTVFIKQDFYVEGKDFN
jgi:aminopeptidase N